jgi:hypothetical protein
MSQIRLYVDEDAAQNLVIDGLRRAGFDVMTANQAGKRGATDEAQFAHAIADGRALYTLNAAHFARLHAEATRDGRQHAGIIIVPRQRYGPSEKLRRLSELLAQTAAEQIANQIVYL